MINNALKIATCVLTLMTGCLPLSSAASDKTDNAVSEPFTLEGKAEALFAAGNGDFAPYYIASNNHGILTQSKDALLRLSLDKKTDTSRRFSYGFGIDLFTGYTSSTDYLRYSPDYAPDAVPVADAWFIPHPEHPSRIWLQQLYGEIRYRGIFVTVGMKEQSSTLLSHTLSSGDLVESGNSRPIPEVRVGFNDFQNIPFTKGWVQIRGEISYGKMMDNAWLRNHYNYYNSHLNQGALYTYKQCYFRSKPSERFSVTFGMQVGAFFGGETKWYDHGRLTDERKFSKGIKQFFKMFIPTDGGLSYYSGSNLGSWDFMFRYRLNNGSEIKAYLQKPWEDGSGIGFLNGFDGVWGLQFVNVRNGIVSGAVIEYIDFTNQSGPIHWDPDDAPGTTVTNRAEGADDYYYNHEYNSYANYGMAIGSPFMVSPIYNTDGYLHFAANRLRGFHVGIEGNITSDLSYRLLGGYRKSWGSGHIPFRLPKDDTSFMIEAAYQCPMVKGLAIKAAFGLDHGKLYGNTAGGMLTVSFNGPIKIRR
ncbi:MAG: capsule assembly Wzi family protein [Muribaculaceae bacterium]|nr:capsule assembly Wzi family protein [Muribaculaceae bacterium]